MALVSSYEGLIFDYGGVLVEHQSDADQEQLASTAGIPKEVFTPLYWAARPDYDKDALSSTEYWQSLGREAGKQISTDVADRLTEMDVASWMRFDPVMWQWAKELRSAGKRVAILSNMPRDLGDALKSTTERLNDFDQITLSYEVRSAKPDPAIFEHCLEGLGLPSEQTLFLDDRIENVQAAEVLGIRSIQFTSRDDVLLLLRA
jgi:putative hydrolase of the HAD superfamily